MAKGSIVKNFTQYDYQLIVDWESTSDIANNTSVVEATIYLNIIYSLNVSAHSGHSITINGVSYDFESPSINVSTGEKVKIATITSNAIAHGSDGKKTITITCDYRFNATISGTYHGTITASDEVELDLIPRQATLSSAPNFDDEDNPKITYSNPAGSAVGSLQACIADENGETIYVAYRDITKTSSSYTFSLTTAERNALRNAIPNDTSMTVKFYVKTVIGDKTYYSSLAKTFSVVNANPTLNPTVEDTNTTAIGLTGDKNKLIRYFSNVSITTGAAAIKGATLSSQRASCGGKSITTATGTINSVESGSFVFTATDSRGLSTTQTIEKDIVKYVKLSCNIKGTPDATGTYDLVVSGNYFNGSFGAKSNNLTVEYRYCVKGEEFGAWHSMTIVPGIDTYTATDTITGLDYQTAYDFQARASDLISSVEKTKTIKAAPVFDWSENDFNFNVPGTYTDDTGSYNFTQIGKALMVNTPLTCEVSPGANYTSASGSIYQVGNVLRVYFTATRSSSISAGNNENETICSFSVDTGGRVVGVYAVYAICANNNSAIYLGNSSVSGDTLTFDITLSSVGIAGSNFSSYFVAPARIDLSKY